MPTSPRTPAQHHYIEAEQTLATLGSLGADEAERIVEVLTAICHAVLSVAATLAPPAPPADDRVERLVAAYKDGLIAPGDRHLVDEYRASLTEPRPIRAATSSASVRISTDDDSGCCHGRARQHHRDGGVVGHRPAFGLHRQAPRREGHLMSNLIELRTARRARVLDDYERGALDALEAWEAHRRRRVRRARRSLAERLRGLAERVDYRG